MGADHARRREDGHATLRKLRRFHRTDAETGRIGTRARAPFGSQLTIEIGQQVPKVRAAFLAHGVLAQVDAGNHDLAVAGLKQTARFEEAILWSAAARRAARQRNDAVGAAVRAAVLYLEHGAGAAEGGDTERRIGAIPGQGARPGLLRGGGKGRLRRQFRGAKSQRRRGEKAGLGVLPENRRHAGKRPQFLARDLGGAARDDDRYARRVALQTAYGLTRVADGVGGHGTGIEQDEVRPGGIVRLRAPHPLPRLAQGLRLVLIDLAAERENAESPEIVVHGPPRRARRFPALLRPGPEGPRAHGEAPGRSRSRGNQAVFFLNWMSTIS